MSSNHAAVDQHPITALAAPVAVPSASGGTDLAALTAMASALGTTGHNVMMRTEASTMKGAVDPAHKTSMATVSNGTISIDEIVSNGKVFVRANFGPNIDSQLGIAPDAWMMMDPARIMPNNALLIQPNGTEPVDLAGISTGITSLTRTDPQHLKGTIDLTKVTGHTVPNPDEVSKAGLKATSVPFTVRADSSGRISELAVTADAFDPALSLDVLYTDYGSPTAISVPTGSTPAPDNMYSVFND
jgi:hypothetical protein